MSEPWFFTQTQKHIRSANSNECVFPMPSTISLTFTVHLQYTVPNFDFHQRKASRLLTVSLSWCEYLPFESRRHAIRNLFLSPRACRLHDTLHRQFALYVPTLLKATASCCCTSMWHQRRQVCGTAQSASRNACPENLSSQVLMGLQCVLVYPTTMSYKHLSVLSVSCEYEGI